MSYVEDFSIFKGKVFEKTEGMKKDSHEVVFTTTTGEKFKMYHEQDCCESVWLEDVCGDLEDILNSPILDFSERISEENPEDASKEAIECQDSFTWTFYVISTVKGSVTLRWYGESNGYYGESVDVKQLGGV